MGATATLNSRIDSAEKERFVRTANALGLSPSAAINVFVYKFNEMGGFPFDVRTAAVPLESEAEACNYVDSLAKDMINDAW